MTEPTADGALYERLAKGVRAAESLTEVLWEALHEELAIARETLGGTPGRVGELSRGLAQVASTVALLVYEGEVASSSQSSSSPPAGEQGAGEEERTVPAPARPLGPARPLEPARPSEPAAGRWPDGTGASGEVRKGSLREPHRGSDEEGVTPAIIVDERVSPKGDARPGHPRPAGAGPAGIAIRDERVTESAGEAGPEEAGQGEAVPVKVMPPGKAVPGRAGRGEAGGEPWIASIGRRLERYARDGVPFAVLLLELVDVERLRHAELPGAMARLTGLVEEALAAELRPADSLMREAPGRYWLLAPETDTATAKRLAAALAGRVRAAASHRGTPLGLAAGIAVCPEDGRQAAALVAQADIALYAAQAAGVPHIWPEE